MHSSPTEPSRPDPGPRKTFITIRGLGPEVAGEVLAGTLVLVAAARLLPLRPSLAQWVGMLALLITPACLKRAFAPRSLLGRAIPSLVVLILAAALPLWPLGSFGRATLLILAQCAANLFRLAGCVAVHGKPVAPGEQIRLLLLGGATATTMWPYFTPRLVGPIDAAWYGRMMTDFLAQFRAGHFPVLTGETSFAFNGAVHPHRSAPALENLGALFDLLTGRTLTPVAVQHLTLIAVGFGGAFAMYLTLVHLRPLARWTALLFTVLFISSPALTTPLIAHDMYMTWCALPVMVLLYGAVARLIEQPTPRLGIMAGIALAALWFCHPPQALLAMLVTGFMLAGILCCEKPPAAMFGALGVAAGAFGGLSAGYLSSMTEIARDPGSQPVRHLLLPALALAGVAAAAVRTLQQMNLRWLGLLAAAAALLWVVHPQLLPFAGIGCLLLAAWFRVGVGWRSCQTDTRLEAVVGLLLGSAAALSGWLFPWFPQWPKQAGGLVDQGLADQAAHWVGYFRPPDFPGTSDQPGLAGWIVFAMGSLAVWHGKGSRFARWGFNAVFLLILSLIPFLPHAARFIWRNAPDEITSVIGISYSLRLLPAAIPLLLVAGFVAAADSLTEAPRFGRAWITLLVAVLPWAAWQEAGAIRKAFDFTQSEEVHARLSRSENSALERYSYDLLPVPRYFSHGVLDPRIETRLWSADKRQLLIGPDDMARAMETGQSETITFTGSHIPTGPEWIYLRPMLQLAPGEHRLLRFEQIETIPNGVMIFRGQGFYREYIMPDSGQGVSFGTGPESSRTVSLWNTSTQPLEIEIAYTGPFAIGKPDGVFARARYSRFDLARAPIRLESLTPYHAVVEATDGGLLETFRVNVPGYKVTLNGRRVAHQVSAEGLVEVPLDRGTNDIIVEFRGSPTFWRWFWWSVAAWTAAAAFLAREIYRAARGRPGFTTPAIRPQT